MKRGDTPAEREISHRIGMRIRNRRIELGLSQQQIGDALGITFQQIYKYERGVNRIATARLATFAKVLGVSTAYLLGTEGDAMPAPNPRERLTLELVRLFSGLASHEQDAVMALVHGLSRGGVAAAKAA